MDNKLLVFQRWSIFLYGIFSYMVGLAGQIWFILYLGEWEFMERTVYSAQTLPVWAAVIINTGLVLLFGIQHTVMARQWFKDQLIRYLPQSAERSTYVLLSGISLIVVVLFWQPIDGTVWKVDAEPWHTGRHRQLGHSRLFVHIRVQPGKMLVVAGPRRGQTRPHLGGLRQQRLRLVARGQAHRAEGPLLRSRGEKDKGKL